MSGNEWQEAARSARSLGGGSLGGGSLGGGSLGSQSACTLSICGAIKRPSEPISMHLINLRRDQEAIRANQHASYQSAAQSRGHQSQSACTLSICGAKPISSIRSASSSTTYPHAFRFVTGGLASASRSLSLPGVPTTNAGRPRPRAPDEGGNQEVIISHQRTERRSLGC